jgi:hypothetical protein
MHSDLTLDIMDDVTTALGKAFRLFQQTICPLYGTRELPREANARKRRRKQGADPAEKPLDEPLKKEFNIQTYKYHSLGDYVDTIRRLGTTDSYSTTVVSNLRMPCTSIYSQRLQGELEHRTSKARYLRTDRRSFVKQLTRIERRQTRLNRIKRKLSPQIPVEGVATTPEAHHHIGMSENRYEHIGTFLRSHSGDPAMKVEQFISWSPMTRCSDVLEFFTPIKRASAPSNQGHAGKRQQCTVRKLGRLWHSPIGEHKCVRFRRCVIQTRPPLSP